MIRQQIFDCLFYSILFYFGCRIIIMHEDVAKWKKVIAQNLPYFLKIFLNLTDFWKKATMIMLQITCLPNSKFCILYTTHLRLVMPLQNAYWFVLKQICRILPYSRQVYRLIPPKVKTKICLQNLPENKLKFISYLQNVKQRLTISSKWINSAY